MLVQLVLVATSLYIVNCGPAVCPDGWEKGDQSCFKTIMRDPAFTYKTATDYCKKLGGYPAAVESEKDREAINRSTNTSVSIFPAEPNELFIILIGALNSNEGLFPPKFYWEKSNKSIENDDVRWYPGQPNPLSKWNTRILDENCLMYTWEPVGSDQTVLFRDYPCDCSSHLKACRALAKGIVCQRDAEPI